MNTIFISGTDTGVGKTFCAAAMALEIKELGKTVAYFKPVESGCLGQRSSDLEFVNKHIKDVFSLYRLKNPISPHLAARQDGIEISVAEIKKKIAELSSEFDFLIIEGAGGLLVPITDNYDFSNLVSELDLPLVLVAGSKLGMLNQAKLNFEYIRQRQIKILGYVFNETFSLSEAERLGQLEAIKTNRQALQEVAENYGISELFALPFLSELPERESLLELMDNTLFSDKIREI